MRYPALCAVEVVVLTDYERAAIVPHAHQAMLPNVVYVQCHTQRYMDSYQIPRIVMLAGWLMGNELVGREDKPQMVGWSARRSTIRRMSELETMLEPQ